MVSLTTNSPTTYNLSLRSTRSTPRLLFHVSGSQPMHDSSSHLVPAEWLAAERQQVWGRDSGHTCPAAFGCLCLRSRCGRHHSTSLVLAEVPRRDHLQSHALWQSRRSCRQGVHLPHSFPATFPTTETAQTIKRAAASRHESTTATRCCMALLLQSSRSCRELKTTSPGSSVSSAECVRARLLLKSLHWLHVQQRIQYKIAVITHKPLSTSVPTYIDELLYNAKWRRGLCGPPTLRVSLCRRHALKQPSERSVWRLRTPGTHYRMTFVTPVCCQASAPNCKHTFYCCILVMTYSSQRSILTFS